MNDPCDDTGAFGNGLYPFRLYPYQRALFDTLSRGGRLAVIPSRRSGRTAAREEWIHERNRHGQPVVVLGGASGWYTLRMDDPCDEVDHERVRPPVPVGEDVVWYRGWECGWDRMADHYTGAGYSAYKGGVDLDAPRVDSHGTWRALLDAVDDEEDG